MEFGARATGLRSVSRRLPGPSEVCRKACWTRLTGLLETKADGPRDPQVGVHPTLPRSPLALMRSHRLTKAELVFIRPLQLKDSGHHDPEIIGLARGVVLDAAITHDDIMNPVGGGREAERSFRCP